MGYLDGLGMFLTALYIAIEVLAFFWFMDAFAERRCKGLAFAEYWAVISIIDFIAVQFINSPDSVHILTNLLLFMLAACLLYPSMHKAYSVLLTVIFYIAMYSFDFGIFALCTALLEIDMRSFNQTIIPVIVRGVASSILVLCTCAAIKRICSPVKYKKLRWEYISLALLFPLASLVVLLVLLQIAFRKQYDGWAFVFCTLFLALANFALLVLLNQLEKSEESHQKQLALEQMLQLQAKNMDALCAAYSQQRKLTHDFNHNINTLQSLLESKEWEAAQNFLERVQEKQTVRSLLINSRHPILDAVLNQKAYAAEKNKINIHFEINDLSKLALDPVDISTMFANLLDNAIEACVLYPGEKRLMVKVLLGKTLFFSIQNTSNPVIIKNNCIATTKSNPHLHGFGLENVKMILKKYHGEFCMKYKDNCFLFVGEILNTPIS